jgi:hypothetical protein
MPMLAKLANIISLPYLGQANQIQETVIPKVHYLLSISSKRTHKLNLVLRFHFPIV